MERYVAFHVTKHLERNGLLSQYQFGFRSGYSTLHPLLILHQLSADCLDKLQELSIVALDIAGAFDTVWHKRLVEKCQSMGICGKLLTWLTDYLNGRGQVVTVDGSKSSVLPVAAGVPQGSILGPLMFLIYINDLPDAIDALSLMFADDCTILQPISRPSLRPTKRAFLQSDIDNLCRWAKSNQINFAPHKTQLMTISRRNDRRTNLQTDLTMDGTIITEVESVKLLGVSFAGNGSVTDHILQKAETAGKLVGMLRRQARFLSEQARYHIFVAAIRPLMEYASPVFTNASVGCLTVLERIQQRAARLFPSLQHKLDSVRLRRDVAGLSQVYRIVDGTAPAAISNHLKLDFLRVSRTTRSTESTNLRALEIPKSRTEHHKRAFIPYYSRLWNNLSNDTVFADTLGQFKKKASRELRDHCRDSVIGRF